ncbi:Phosphoglycerate mutase family protein [Taphrina deformans PYCC 5710]|uniref:Phosphoglycerate mutase family protein n=1 Tax=Taphrina deformans (strain PYCC 5710 / ATCC 11124 / CBS 356.35 / IMI 108563 / JCM 9778 / NBRC 8474) TaxID=1097556 RepID=R4XD66_TAPDE|nr:Phosphoglycerate mutase family protein [Taphrina deformans PYCC 5710]|eukprot:CCG82348.1 Phosphoglycerate mutase family protein [Taphrina deformans PYCC 5710]
MAKRIYLIRHAQAEHNVNEEYHIPDAKLTKLGESQAAQICENNPRLSQDSTRPQVIFTSPLTRTIQTSKIGFKNKAASCDIIPVAELQENSAMPCDTGSKLHIVKERFPDLDFSRVPQNWNNKRGPWEDSQTALSARAQKLRDMLAERPEERIAVVTHGGFCSYLIGTYTRFNNAECREFDLCKVDGGAWKFLSASSTEEKIIEKHVEEEAVTEDAEHTFAATEMPTKI